ncbi:MAG TPA: metalloregulator ArsR/SmtB family transcription factor [Gemmatimonadaceae bacterium]|nr:metalloregulator ArsR/SmtB family transcription factor [Gemmatimonadaceae bacterium]
MPHRPLSPEQIDLVADRFRILGDPTRLRILSALRDGERNVSDLVRRTGIAQANLSKHLGLLLRLGFVERRRDGLNAFYSLADTDVFRLCDLMCGRLEKELRARRRALSV